MVQQSRSHNFFKLLWSQLLQPSKYNETLWRVGLPSFVGGQEMCYVYWIIKIIERRPSLLSKLFLPNYIDNINSWSHLVKPNTEELISRPLLDENSIWQLFWDYLDPWPATGGFSPALCHFCIEFHWFPRELAGYFLVDLLKWISFQPVSLITWNCCSKPLLKVFK